MKISTLTYRSLREIRGQVRGGSESGCASRNCSDSPRTRGHPGRGNRGVRLADHDNHHDVHDHHDVHLLDDVHNVDNVEYDNDHDSFHDNDNPAHHQTGSQRRDLQRRPGGKSATRNDVVEDSC